MTTYRGSLLIPLGRDHICGRLSEHSDVHALVTRDAWRHQREGGTTVRTVCGVDVYVLGIATTLPSGGSSALAIAWPPPTADRCRNCDTATPGPRHARGSDMWQRYAQPTHDDTEVSQP